MTETHPKPQVADAATQLILQFVRSIKSVLGTMSSIPVQVGTPFRSRGRSPGHDVSSLIGFSGQYVGSMVLSFPMATAKEIVKGFAGSEVDPESADFSDAIGELANMIAGDTKAALGESTLISVPNIVIGANHAISGLQDVTCLMLPCTTKVGAFSVAINIKPGAGRPA